MSLHRTIFGSSLTPSRTVRFSAGAAGRAQPNPSLFTAGANISNNTRFRTLFGVGTRKFDVSYGNFYNGGTTEADGPNVYTVRAAVEYPSGTFTPIYFGGQRDIAVQVGALVTSDPIYLDIPANTAVWIRTCGQLSATNLQFPILGSFDSANGEGSVTATSFTDLTTSGAITAGAGYGLAPFRVRALDILPGTLCVGVIGDSWVYGLNDTFGGKGFVSRAFDGVVNYQKVGFSSEQGVMFNANATRRRRLALIDGANVGLSCYGVNDIGSGGASLATAKTILQGNWAILASLGMKVFQSTLPPRTTSSDAWATTTNQTVAVSEAVRTALNDWIRTTPAGLVGYVEVADTVETSRNSGKWVVDGTASHYTTDGIHGNGNSYPLVAAALTAAIPAMIAAVT